VEPEAIRRENMKSNKGGKVVYYDTKVEEEEKKEIKIDLNIDENMMNDEVKEVKIQYGLNEMIRIFKNINQDNLKFTESLN
jgi:hypothetical protein